MARPRRKTGDRAVARFLAAAFVAAIALPGALLLAGRDETKDVRFEYRPPAPAPRLDASFAALDAFPASFERWFGDRFGLRGPMLRLRARLRWYGLGTSPSDLMLRGKGDWLMPTSSRAIENSSGLCPLTEREVEEWLDAIEERSAHLARRGIVHLVALAPDKSSVYPERLPWNHRAGSPRRAEQLAQRARERGMRQFLDLLPAIVEAKSQERPGDPLYYPLGPHWCSRGAVAGALAIRDRLAELGVPLAPTDPAEVRYVPPLFPDADSWAGRLYLEGALTQEFLDGEVHPDAAAVIVHRDDKERTVVFQRVMPGGPTLAVFHDSFGEGAQPHLSRAARRAFWHWRSYDEALVDANPPDAVVELFCERLLTTRLPARDDPSGEPARREAFDASTAVSLVVDGADWSGRVRRDGPRSTALRDSAPSDLVFDDRGVSYALDLSRLPADADHLVRLGFTSTNAGRVVIRYPFTNGPANYRVESLQRSEHAIERGEREIVFHLARQRTSDVVDVSFVGGPCWLTLGRLEARAIHRSTAQPAR